MNYRKDREGNMRGYNNGRFELRTISPHFGQTVVGTFDSIEAAQVGKDLKMRSQDLPLVIYDIKTDRPITGSIR